jgi:copper chaperone CopZ
MNKNSAELKIQNLKCHGCANTITTQLSKLEGVGNVKVSNETNSVIFSYLGDQDLEAAIKKLSALGYPIEGDSNALHQKAKSFVSCAVGRMNS